MVPTVRCGTHIASSTCTSSWTPIIISPSRRVWGTYCFGVSVRVRVASCLHSFFWTNRWILTKPAQTHYWDGGKKRLHFGDLDLIFKVTPALWMTNVAPYLLNQAKLYILYCDKCPCLYWIGAPVTRNRKYCILSLSDTGFSVGQFRPIKFRQCIFAVQQSV